MEIDLDHRVATGDAVVDDEAATAVASVAKRKPAAKRVAKRRLVARTPVHEPVHEAPREPMRVRHKDVGGRFAIPEEFRAKLPGRSLEWKRYTVFNQEDPAYQLELKRKGWEPVQSYQMPGMMPHGHKGVILRDGMILMERPQELTDEARAEERQEASDRIVNNERRLGLAGPGEMTRDHPLAQPRINHTYEPLPSRAAPQRI